MKTCRFFRTTVIGCALLVLTTASARADGPRTELARLVPDEVAVCLLFGDLRGQTEKLQKSGWLKKVRSSPLGNELADALEGTKLGQFGELLQKRLGVTWPQLRDEVLGDAVILAYQPGPPGRPEDEQGVLLLQARNPALLAKLLDRLNEVQKKSGELKSLQVRKHQGKSYVRRVEGDSEQFYYLDGGLLAFSATESMIKRVLDRAARPKDAALPPLAQHVRLAGADKALATLWLHPRALDAELKEKLGGLEGQPAHVFKVFLRYWQALEGVSVSLTLEPEAEVRLALQVHNERLPPAARRVVAESGKPSELWSRFPKDSVLTVAGRVEVPALLDWFQEWMPPEANLKMREEVRANPGLALGKRVFQGMLPHLGPDCGLCLLPAAKGGPPQVLLAVRVRAGKPGQLLDRSLFQSLKFLVGVAVLDHNRKHKDQMEMKTEHQGKVEVKYLVNAQKFPKGFAPAFALKEGYLLVASSPEAVRRFATGPVPLPDGKEGAPLLRLSLPELTRLLQDQREGVLTLLGEKYGLPREFAVAALAGLMNGLELFEDVRMSQRNEGSRTVWLVRLRTAVKE